jgi:hypothetical protein
VATISEIAKAADVSVESVLRVMNRDEVNADVASRVVAAMDAYGYDRLPRPASPVAKRQCFRVLPHRARVLQLACDLHNCLQELLPGSRNCVVVQAWPGIPIDNFTDQRS